MNAQLIPTLFQIQKIVSIRKIMEMIPAEDIINSPVSTHLPEDALP